MKITQPGFYRLTEDFSSRGSMSISHLPNGMIIQITQIDVNGNKVIGPQFLGWVCNDIPCEREEQNVEPSPIGNPGGSKYE